MFKKRVSNFSEQKQSKKGRFSPFFVALFSVSKSSWFSEQGAVYYVRKKFLISALGFSWYTRRPNHFLFEKRCLRRQMTKKISSVVRTERGENEKVAVTTQTPPTVKGVLFEWLPPYFISNL